MTGMERVRDALSSRGSKIEAQGQDRFLAQCPSHDDGRPSLSVRQGDRGALLFCFAGCAPKDIAADLGLSLQQLFDADRIDYRYQDRQGETVRTVTRTPSKDFRQSGKTKTAKGTSPLYRLPEVLAGLKADRPVWIVEGEKDVEHLLLAGVVATTSVGGAAQPEYTDWTPLAGAEVRILPDQDSAGFAYRDKIVELLGDSPKSVTFWKVADGCKDFSDHYAAGYTLADLREVPGPQEAEDREEKTDSHDQDQDEESSLGEIELTWACDVEIRVVHWLWQGRLPLGTLTLLAGKQGLGKSTLSAWIAAKVTRGELDGQSSGTPSTVLWVTSEEDPTITTVPRLKAAGADLSRVAFVSVKLPSGVSVLPLVPRHLQKLEDTARRTGAVLMIVDPLISVLDSKVDTYKDHSLRQALDPLQQLAMDTGMTVLGLAHVGKPNDKRRDFVDRILGSTGFTAASRSVLGLVEDPQSEGEQRVCLGLAKTNLTDRTKVPMLSFAVRSADIAASSGETTKVSTAALIGTDTRTLSELLEDSDDSGEREDRDEAESWLRSYLEERGGEALANEIRRDSQRDGINYNSLKRGVCKRLGVVKSKSGLRGGWLWSLPEAQTEDREEEDPPAPADQEVVLGPCQNLSCVDLAQTTVAIAGKRKNLCHTHAALAVEEDEETPRLFAEGETA